MNSENEKLALIDIGNSRFKFFYDNTLNLFNYVDSWQSEFSSFLNNLALVPNIVILSSVNGNIRKQIETVLNDYSITVINSKMLLDKQNIIDFSDISGMGNDRKSGLIGALNYHKPPLITVDCGTAVTINVLNESNKCLGGVIFADIYTQAKGLSHNTADLREVDLYFEKKILGKNTEQALRFGIVNSVIYGVKGIVGEIIKREFGNKKVPIILTGGSAIILAKGLRDWEYNFEIKENLVLEGLSFLYRKDI